MPAGKSVVARVKKSPGEPDAAWVGQFADEYKDHPLSDLFPAMEGDDYAALVEDIRKHGLRQPVILCEGKILDGRRRYHACQHAGADCWFEAYDGDDPLGYVVRLNLKRRHLDTSQRAMVAAKLATLKQGQKSNTAIAVSQEAAAKSLNVSVDNVQRAWMASSMPTRRPPTGDYVTYATTQVRSKTTIQGSTTTPLASLVAGARS